MKAITILQPWAWVILYGNKDIENRVWKTEYRGKVLLHAGKNFPLDYYYYCSGYLIQEHKILLPPYDKIPLGAIVGIADLVDCVKKSDSIWFEGPYGFVLRNVKPLEPIPCKGALNIWDVPENIAKLVQEQLQNIS
ncbi:MAG: ASCH domain-containing protein [Verrucomicrobiia bacterium]